MSTGCELEIGDHFQRNASLADLTDLLSDTTPALLDGLVMGNASIRFPDAGSELWLGYNPDFGFLAAVYDTSEHVLWYKFPQSSVDKVTYVPCSFDALAPTASFSDHTTFLEIAKAYFRAGGDIASWLTSGEWTSALSLPEPPET